MRLYRNSSKEPFFAAPLLSRCVTGVTGVTSVTNVTNVTDVTNVTNVTNVKKELLSGSSFCKRAADDGVCDHPITPRIAEYDAPNRKNDRKTVRFPVRLR